MQRLAIYCFCGRQSVFGLDTCKKHIGKTKPEPKKRSVKFSGDSAWRTEQGMFQSKIGR